MKNETFDAITCECVTRWPASSLRRLDSTNVTSVTVNYLGLLTSVATQFETTLLSAGSLNNASIAQGWQAMVTVGTLALGVLIAMMVSHYLDSEEKKIATGKTSQEWKRRNETRQM